MEDIFSNNVKFLPMLSLPVELSKPRGRDMDPLATTQLVEALWLKNLLLIHGLKIQLRTNT